MPEPLMQSLGARGRPEVDLLLSCARTQITPESSDRIRGLAQKNVDWIALVRLALRHDVMPLLYRGLQQVCPEQVPSGILGPMQARYQSQSVEARRLADELVRILGLLRNKGFLAVPYKGPVLAQRLYGDLSLREFSDLDIMVLERELPWAQELIRSAGYELSHLKDTGKLAQYVRRNRELQLRRPDGVLLELHWRFALQLAYVKDDPDRFLMRFETVSLAGAEVYSLPLEVYFLVLSMHATKHKWRQLKLICDIAEILKKSDLDWHHVTAEAADLGLRRMIAVGVLLAEDLLDVAAPPELARGVKIDRTARSLAAEVHRGLFEEPDKNWHNQADFPFQVRIRERFRDRAGMLYRNLLPRLRPMQVARLGK